jgi:hypothetical protein
VVSDARALEALTSRPPAVLRVRVPLERFDRGSVERLHQLFIAKPGRCRVSFDLIGSDGSAATLDSDSPVLADKELLDGVREICGSDSLAVVQ